MLFHTLFKVCEKMLHQHNIYIFALHYFDSYFKGRTISDTQSSLLHCGDVRNFFYEGTFLLACSSFDF